MQPEEIKTFLSEWFNRAQRAETSHYASAAYFGRLHNIIGIPAMVTGIIVGSSILADTTGILSIIMGVLGILAGALSGVQTFLKLGDKSEAHRMAGSRFSALKREIEQRIIFIDIVTDEYVNDLRMRWDSLTDEAPTVPEWIWNKTNATI